MQLTSAVGGDWEASALIDANFELMKNGTCFGFKTEEVLQKAFRGVAAAALAAPASPSFWRSQLNAVTLAERQSCLRDRAR
jgi:hypothetical protein